MVKLTYNYHLMVVYLVRIDLFKFVEQVVGVLTETALIPVGIMGLEQLASILIRTQVKALLDTVLKVAQVKPQLDTVLKAALAKEQQLRPSMVAKVKEQLGLTLKLVKVKEQQLLRPMDALEQKVQFVVLAF